MHCNDDISNADFLDCMRLRELAKVKPAGQNPPATSGFVSSQNMLASTSRTAISPNQSQIVDMIRRDFCLSFECDDDDELDLETTNKLDSPNVPKSRFGNQTLKTYSKERTSHATPNRVTDNDDQEDRMSCSSGLSVQEAEANEAPTFLPVLSQLDAHSSQKVCENLLNLSESLSTPKSNAHANKDLTKSTTERSDFTNLKDSLQSKNPASADSRTVCDDWSDTDSILADYNTDPSDDLTEKEDKKQPDNDDMLVDIPLSEWQTPMKLPGELCDSAQCSNETVSFWTASKKLIPVSEDTMKKGLSLMAAAAKSSAEETDEVKPSLKGLSRVVPPKSSAEEDDEVKPSHRGLSSVVLPRENRKNISSISKTNTPEITNKNKSLPESKPLQKGLSRVVESRLDHTNILVSKTLKDKPSSLNANTIQIERPSTNDAAIMMSDHETKSLETIKSSTDLQTDKIKNWQPPTSNYSKDTEESPQKVISSDLHKVNRSDLHKTFSACKQIINVSEEAKAKANKLMADLQSLFFENQQSANDACLNKEIPSKDEEIKFHAACNELIGVSNEAEKNVKRILADLEAAIFKRLLPKIPALDDFQAACRKVLNVMEESKNMASKIISNFEEVQKTEILHSNDNANSPADKNISPNSCSNSPGESDHEINATSIAYRTDLLINKEENSPSGESEPEISSGEDFNGFPTDNCEKSDDFSELETPKNQKRRNSDKINEPRLETASKSQPEIVFTRTPSCQLDIHPSLSQLVNRSPLDKTTKSAIIGRRNLLTLNRRKRGKEIRPEVVIQSKKERPLGFAPMSTSTSTPLVDRNPNVMDRNNCDREDLTPTYTPENRKRRRLGMSRMPHNL